MQPAKFEHAIENILGRDARFDPHAYLFLKDALDFTLKRAAEGNGGIARQVSGPELVAGFRDLAVVSAIGTRAYYRGLGFTDGRMYQHLPLERKGSPHRRS